MANFTDDVGNLGRKISSVKIDLMKFQLTILILEKFNSPSGVKSGVPSSINDKSVKYIPR